MKKYLSILLILMIFFVSGTSAFAMELPDETKNSNKDMLSIDEYNKLYSSNTERTYTAEDIIHFSDTSEVMSNTLSDWKTQTKNVVLKNDGSTIGTVTLRYKTWIQGGRIQFAYDTCTISAPVFNTYWSLTDSYVDFSGDVISVNYNFVFGPLDDTAWVYFYPQ